MADVGRLRLNEVPSRGRGVARDRYGCRRPGQNWTEREGSRERRTGGCERVKRTGGAVHKR